MYNIFVEHSGHKYWLCNIDIDDQVFYRPSQKIITSRGKYSPKYGFEETDNEKIWFDHVSFHKDGKVHVTKKKSGKKINIYMSKDRLALEKVGQQLVLVDFIEDIKKLPQEADYEGCEELSFLLDGVNSIFFRVDILALDYNYSKIPKEDAEGKLLYSQGIGFGAEQPIKQFVQLSVFEWKVPTKGIQRRISYPICQNNKR